MGDIDVELLNWEDCCQHMVARVDKMWKQHSGQKYKSVMGLLSKKADHSVLRLLQISQQHIESQLDRVRHERELWKEVVDKRAQQPLQLALTLKDPHTGQPLGGPPGFAGGPAFAGGMAPDFASARPPPGPADATPRAMGPAMAPGMVQGAGGMVGAPDQQGKGPSPLAKRIARPPAPQVPKS